MSDVVLEQVKELATRLSPAEKARLIEWLEATLDEEGAAPATPTPSRSLYGLCADLGLGPTDEDIEEVRHEMWSKFAHEDIGGTGQCFSRSRVRLTGCKDVLSRRRDKSAGYVGSYHRGGGIVSWCANHQ